MNDIFQFIESWYNTWINLSFSGHLVHLLGGLIGAIIFCAWTMPVIKMPEYDKENGILRLNSIGILVVGVFIAWIVNTHFVFSLLGGFLGPKLAEVIINKILPGFGSALVRWATNKAAPLNASDNYNQPQESEQSFSQPSSSYSYYGGGFQGKGYENPAGENIPEDQLEIVPKKTKSFISRKKKTPVNKTENVNVWEKADPEENK